MPSHPSGAGFFATASLDLPSCGQFLATYAPYARHKELVQDNRCSVVEDPVEHSVPMPSGGCPGIILCFRRALQLFRFSGQRTHSTMRLRMPGRSTAIHMFAAVAIHPRTPSCGCRFEILRAACRTAGASFRTSNDSRAVESQSRQAGDTIMVES